MCTSSRPGRPFAMLTAGDRPSFVDMDQGTRERLIHSLSSWHFEPHKLPEEEVIACSYILFEALYRIEHLYETVAVPLSESQIASSPSLSRSALGVLGVWTRSFVSMHTANVLSRGHDSLRERESCMIWEPK